VIKEEKSMSFAKTAVFGGLAGLAAGLSMIAIAQAQSKSSAVTSLNEGDAIYVGKNGAVHKSNTQVSAAKHQAAVAKGATEITGPAVMYRQAGKMYMFHPGAAANTNAAENFQDQFDVDY
jgi:hypothetical protein